MANALTLIMPLLPGTTEQELQTLAQFQPQLEQALASIGTVHYARSLLLDAGSPNLQPGTPTSNSRYLTSVITEYDGSFDAYIGDFVAQVGTVFDALLQYVVGGAAVTPVADNVQAFQAFIAANDASQHAPNTGLYQAYPYTVQQILANG